MPLRHGVAKASQSPPRLRLHSGYRFEVADLRESIPIERQDAIAIRLYPHNVANQQDSSLEALRRRFPTRSLATDPPRRQMAVDRRPQLA